MRTAKHRKQTLKRHAKKHGKKHRGTRKSGGGYGRSRGPREKYTPIKINQANINAERAKYTASLAAPSSAVNQSLSEYPNNISSSAANNSSSSAANNSSSSAVTNAKKSLKAAIIEGQEAKKLLEEAIKAADDAASM